MKINEYLGEEARRALRIGPYEGDKSKKRGRIHWCKDVPSPHWYLAVYTFGHFMDFESTTTFVDHEVLAGLGFDQLDKAKEKANEILGVIEDTGTEFSYVWTWRWTNDGSGGAFGGYGWRGM